MFKEANCNLCGVCLDQCQFIDFSGKDGGIEFKKLIDGEPVEWLQDCVTCMRCTEQCPLHARPFDLILTRLAESGTFTDPELVAQMADRFLAKKDPKPIDPKKKVMSICVMNGNMPWATQGQLFENEDLTILKGLPYFCNVLFAHMGNDNLMRERAQKQVDNLAATGAKEIIFVHEDCYAMFSDIAPDSGVEVPFRPVHIFEYLRDYLQEHSDQITKLNMKVAYQRPCASRHTPEDVENILDEIFELIGVERVERKYDRKEALCCGVEIAGPELHLFPRGKNFEPYRDMNIQDAKDSGAEAMVYLCPMCYKTLREKAGALSMQNYMVSDICRLALGEELPADKPQ